VTAARYGIRSIPTLLMFQGGQVMEQRVGALPQGEIESLLERQLVGVPALP
jgi:thioredoxin 1